MDVPVELSKIIINEASDQQVIVLKERGGSRGFPIVIGIVEIFAIDRRLKGMIPPRPMTHDLIQNIIDGLGAKIKRITVSDLRDHTFYATITLEISGKKVDIDSRPSDAIALAVATDAELYVNEKVFEKLKNE